MTNRTFRPVHTAPAFYDDLIEWEVVEELLGYFQDHERASAHSSLMQTIDTAAHHFILEQLPEEVHHEYLDLCERYHHDKAILSWLEDHQPNMSAILRQRLQETKQTLRAAITQIEELEEQVAVSNDDQDTVT